MHKRQSNTSQRILLNAWGFSTALFLVFNTQAGGLEVPDLGTVALGRGAAFVARADNLSAFYYNPAGLSKQKGPNVMLGVNMLHSKVEFLRSGNDREIEIAPGVQVQNPSKDYSTYQPLDGIPPEAFSTVTLEGGGFPSTTGSGPIGLLPSLIFNWGDVLGIEGLAIAGGILPPTSFGAPKYPDDGAQRYALRDAHFLIMHPGVGVSYAFNRYIQVGAVFMSGFALLKQSQAIRPFPQKDDIVNFNEDLDGDAHLKVDVADHFMPTGVIGVLSNPLDWLEIGLAIKLPMYIKAKGKVEYTAPKVAFRNSALVKGQDDVTLSQHFPLAVRLGARYIHERFDVELDFVFENWASLDGFDIDMEAVLDEDTTDPNSPKEDMPDTLVPKHFRNTYCVRLGGDIVVWPKHITVRLGGYVQSSAYPKNFDTFSLDFPFATQIGLSGGITWHAMKYLDVHAGYMHVFQPDVTVTEGIIQQQGKPMEDANGNEVSPGNTVNNGTYKVALNLFGVSLEGHF